VRIEKGYSFHKIYWSDSSPRQRPGAVCKTDGETSFRLSTVSKYDGLSDPHVAISDCQIFCGTLGRLGVQVAPGDGDTRMGEGTDLLTQGEGSHAGIA
jgi:hypothetical protein